MALINIGKLAESTIFVPKSIDVLCTNGLSAIFPARLAPLAAQAPSSLLLARLATRDTGKGLHT